MEVNRRLLGPMGDFRAHFQDGVLYVQDTKTGRGQNIHVLPTLSSPSNTFTGNMAVGGTLTVTGNGLFSADIVVTGEVSAAALTSNTVVADSVTTNDDVVVNGAIDHNGATAGFYGTAPIAKQTGVAVSAAGIHAALVALGLIGA